MININLIRRPGPARRCPACPLCGHDAMRQYGAKHHGHVSRYFYRCQHCGHGNVWRMIDTSAGQWERNQAIATSTATSSASSSQVGQGIAVLRQPLSSAQTLKKHVCDNTTLHAPCHASAEHLLQRVKPCAAPHEPPARPLPMPSIPQHKPPTTTCGKTCATCTYFIPDDGVCCMPEILKTAILEQFGIAIVAQDIEVNTQKTHLCLGWEEATEGSRWAMVRFTSAVQ